MTRDVGTAAVKLKEWKCKKRIVTDYLVTVQQQCWTSEIIKESMVNLFQFDLSSENLILLYASVKTGYNATHNLHTSPWGTWHSLFSDQSIFYYHMSIVNHFCNKIESAQRNIHTKILCHQKGIFCLRVENVLDSFLFQINSWCWKTSHIRYWW